MQISAQQKREIGHRLKLCRKAKGLTQEQLSEQIGIETKSYSNIETGMRLFSLEILLSLIDTLEVSADFILTGHSTQPHPLEHIINKLDSKNLARLETILQTFEAAVNDRS